MQDRLLILSCQVHAAGTRNNAWFNLIKRRVQKRRGFKSIGLGVLLFD